MTTQEVELAPKPYGPPFAVDRAWSWEASDRDIWVLEAMRDGFNDALESYIKMDERNPEMLRQSGVEITRFRSNRINGSRAIDPDIVMRVMDLDVEDFEKIARYRRDHLDELTAWPRACLDDFAQDVVDFSGEADRLDKLAARSWANAWYEMERLAASWIGWDKAG